MLVQRLRRWPSIKPILDKRIVFAVNVHLFAGLLDHVTVLIGISVRGLAVGGVIYQPYYNYQAGSDAILGRCIWGVIGVGEYKDTTQAIPSNTTH